VTTRLILVRHGETGWNHDLRLQGQTDTELSDFGREQARRLAARLAREELAAAYSSDLRRCVDTTAIALAGRGITPTLVAGLREVNLGDWQGHTTAELRATMPAELERVWGNPVDEAPRGGETRRELQTRVVEAVASIAGRHPQGQVLVVSHGGALRALACWALLADLRAVRRLDLDNCGISRLDFEGGEPTLRRWNDVAHLDGLLDPRTRDARVE
jgi:broad specificity phosphatase PhoE